MKWFLVLLNLVAFCGFQKIEGLERDRISCYVDSLRDSRFNKGCPACLDHSSGEEWGVAKVLFESIPATGPKCRYCGGSSIFWGYLELPEYLPGFFSRH